MTAFLIENKSQRRYKAPAALCHFQGCFKLPGIEDFRGFIAGENNPPKTRRHIFVVFVDIRYRSRFYYGKG